jgi:uncharacterized protein with PIN domain
MAIDTSTLLALRFEEVLAPRLRIAMSSDPVRLMSRLNLTTVRRKEPLQFVGNEVI